MHKEKISIFQLSCLFLCGICGFMIPLFSYEHLSGNSYPVILLIAFVITASILVLSMSIYRAGGLLTGEKNITGNICIIVCLIFIVIIMQANYFMTVDFWTVYNYRSQVHVIYALLIALCVYLCSIFGIEVQARISLLIIIPAGIALLMNFIFLLPQMEFERLYPMDFTNIGSTVKQILYIAALFMPVIIILLLYTPKTDGKLLPKYIYLLYTVGTLMLLAAMLRTILVLGRTTSLFIYPLGQSLKMIQLPGAIGAVELFGFLALMMVSINYLIILNSSGAYILQYLLPNVKFKILCAIPIFVNLLIFLFIFKYPTKILQPFFRDFMISGGILAFISLILKKIIIKKQEKTLQR